jgi:hypothetical protein
VIIMSRKEIGIYLIVLVVVTSSTGRGYDSNSAKTISPLITPQAAVERALAYTGFDNTQELSVSKGNVEAMMTTPDKASVNLMRDKAGSDSLWQVTLKDVQFTLLDKSRPFREQQHRDFTVWLDAVTGKLIRIHSKLPDTVGCVKRKPFYIEMERLMVGNLSAAYHGYPDSLPGISLFDIMQTVVSEPFNKKEITAYYIIYSCYEIDNEPVWIVDIGGMPPFEARQLSSKTDYSLNHMRKVIDPTNGGVHNFTYYGSLGILETDSTGDSTKF